MLEKTRSESCKHRMDRMECIIKTGRAMDTLKILSFNQAIDQLTMANMCIDMLVLRRDDCYVLRRALEFEVEGQRKKIITKNSMEEAS